MLTVTVAYLRKSVDIGVFVLLYLADLFVCMLRVILPCLRWLSPLSSHFSYVTAFYVLLHHVCRLACCLRSAPDTRRRKGKPRPSSFQF